MNDSKESWIDIEGYEGYYQVSNLGNVRSVERTVLQKNGSVKRLRSHMMTKSNGNGAGNYESVMLSKDGKQKRLLVHRLVASAFIPNPLHLKEVNHKDQNKRNNDAQNLEWCTRQYNNTYADVRDRISVTQGIPVLQIDDGKVVARFPSQGSAAKATGATQAGISACLRGECLTSGGYGWRRTS